MMQKVLIITYYWPPSGGSGVQRWLKMSKYLPEFGWQPVIYTADNAEYPVEDFSLEKDVLTGTVVLKQPIVEPYNLYKRFLGIKKEKRIQAGFLSTDHKPSFKENLARWIRGNFFIPDARCLWVKPSVKYLLNYLKENPVEAIISTGPPHSMHLIALKLHKKTGIPWIADFRDPWTEIDFYGELKLTGWADRKHRRLEKNVLLNANKVVAVGWEMAKGLGKIARKEVEIVPNGFDFEIKNKDSRAVLTDKFSITHIGIITPSRNIDCLWEAIGELVKEEPEFAKNLEIKLIGTIDKSVESSLKKQGIFGYTSVVNQMPHDKVVEEQRSSRVLLLLVNNSPNAKSIITGKIYEYLYAKRPILAIGPEDGDAARILNDTGAGIVVDFNDKTRMKTKIWELFSLFKTDTLVGPNNPTIEKYSRKYQAGQFAQLLENAVKP